VVVGGALPLLCFAVVKTAAAAGVGVSAQEVRLSMARVKVEVTAHYEQILQDLQEQLDRSQRSKSKLTAQRDDLVQQMEARVSSIEQQYRAQLEDLTAANEHCQRQLQAAHGKKHIHSFIHSFFSIRPNPVGSAWSPSVLGSIF